MNHLFKGLARLGAGMAVAAIASATAAQIPSGEPAAAAGGQVAAAPVPQIPVAVGAPALWKLADGDTTIYLFGTVHALPKDVEWFNGPVEAALASSQLLVTEIPPGELLKPEVQQAFIARSALPDGQTLRDLLSAEQRTAFEAAVTKLGVPATAFDKVKPWFAAMTLSALPLIKGGYTLEAGVESAIEARAGTKERGALETVETQLSLFDDMPMEVQIAYLNGVVAQMDRVVPSMNSMVSAWARGDAEGLAAQMNEALTDPALAERLLYARNRNWAHWITKRLEQPGTVFVAVGAGHLAGANSVQDYLAQADKPVVRVQ